MEVIKLLRYSIKSRAYLFDTIIHDLSSMINFDANLYWGCVPLLLKNFIGTLTLNDKSFSSMKNQYKFYDLMDKDLYKKSEEHDIQTW